MEAQIELDTLLCYLRQELERIDQSIIALELMTLGRWRPVRRTDRDFSHAVPGKAWSTHRVRLD